MRVKVRHYGEVKRGKKVYYNPELYQKQIDSLEGRKFVEIIEPVVKKPSLDQYGYYRGGILPTCHSSDFFIHFDNKDDIHTLYFAKKYLSYTRLVALPNERYEVTETRSLADLDREEMKDFIDRVLVECANLGIEVLSPEEYYNQFYNKNKKHVDTDNNAQGNKEGE